MKVRLSDILEPIELQVSESNYYLQTLTGHFVMFTEDDMRLAERDEPSYNYPKWQQEQINAVKEFWENEHLYVALPSRYDVHDYEIMERFALSIRSKELSDIIHDALQGKGAFRRFRDALERHGIADDWYQYRDQAYRRIAIQWCESVGVDYEED